MQESQIDPIYTILYVGSHIPPLLPFHLKTASLTVRWVTTTQIKTQGHLLYTYAMVNCDSHQRLPRGCHGCGKLLVTSALCGYKWHRRTCWGQCLCGTCCWAHSLPRPHCQSEDNPWAKLNRGPGLFLSLLHKYCAIYLAVFPNTLSQLTSHSPHSFPLLAYGMEWIIHFIMKAWILKSCLKEEDYSHHWDNSSTVDSQNKAVGREKKPNI